MNGILLTGGTLIDGRRDAAPTKCDLLIEGDRIRRIAPAIRATGARVLAADGLIVAPGFIDAHSHSDLSALQDSSAQGRVYDGVATEVNGTCGFTLFPLGGPSAAQRRAEMAKKKVRADWRDAAGYFARVESSGSAINRGFLAGHGAIRSAVVGYAGRAATAPQIRRMEALLDECLEQGALGFSSGLCYPPGCFAEPGELVALCRRLAAARRPYCTHMRSEGRHLLQSVRESLRVTAAAGAPLHISHLKTNGPANWWKIDRLERALFAARAAGRDVTCDRYPYLAAQTDLSTIFPDWLADGGRARALDRLRSAAVRAKLKKAVTGARTKGGRWETIVISVATQSTREFEGLTVAEAARRLGLEPCEAVFELLLRTKMAVSAIFFGMSEENLRRILKWPFVFMGSDSSSRSLTGPTAEGKPHPRTFGTMARFLSEYALRLKLMPLPEAVARITSLPAERFHLAGRGVLREGAYADIAVFDAREIRDAATYDAPFRLSQGVRHLLVNGAPVLLDGRQTGARPGRVLRA